MLPMRERPTQWFFCLRMFICGLAFYAAATMVPTAMTIEQFGKVAYDIDAETWGIGFMSASALSIYGIHINGRWRWSAVLRILGYTALLTMFLVLTFSALTAPFGTPTVVFGGLFFIPDLVRFLRINTCDFVERFKNGAR